MDLSTQRLKRQQKQQASFRARRMNKTADAVLFHHLTDLQRRQQRNARALESSRAILEREYQASFQTPEHSAWGEAGRRDPVGKERKSLLAWRQVRPQMEQLEGLKRGDNSREQLLDLGKTCTWRADRRDKKRDFALIRDPGFRSEQSDLDPKTDGGRPTSPWPTCRFQATCSKTVCNHFPCSLPSTYNSFGIGAALPPDTWPLTLTRQRRWIATDVKTGFRVSSEFGHGPSEASLPPIHSSLPVFASLEDQCDRVTKPRGRGNATGAESRAAHGSPTHASPRTSIPERLRGLRQLVLELRERNEKKRPREWVLNYGDPVSMRILLKPVVPMSDLVLV